MTVDSHFALKAIQEALGFQIKTGMKVELSLRRNMGFRYYVGWNEEITAKA